MKICFLKGLHNFILDATALMSVTKIHFFRQFSLIQKRGINVKFTFIIRGRPKHKFTLLTLYSIPLSPNDDTVILDVDHALCKVPNHKM